MYQCLIVSLRSVFIVNFMRLPEIDTIAKSLLGNQHGKSFAHSLSENLANFSAHTEVILVIMLGCAM